MRRFLSSPDQDVNQSLFRIYLNMENLGTENETHVPTTNVIIRYTVVGNDNKYFTLNHTFQFGQPGISDLELTDLVWNDETNNLTFSFSFTVDAEYNNSDHELTVSGDVDVFLLEPIQP